MDWSNFYFEIEFTPKTCWTKKIHVQPTGFYLYTSPYEQTPEGWESCSHLETVNTYESSTTSFPKLLDYICSCLEYKEAWVELCDGSLERHLHKKQ